MKKLLALVLVLIIFLSSQSIVIADSISISTLSNTLTINLNEATIEELTKAIQQLEAEKEKRLIAEYSPQYTPNEASTITFRTVPFFSTKKEAESILGIADHYIEIANTSEEYNSGDYDTPGFIGSYIEVSLAGMQCDEQVSYLYPVVDGTIIREKDKGILISGSYGRFEIIDIESTVNSLLEKLSKIYGPYSLEKQDKYSNIYVWKDEAGNKIRLKASFSYEYIQLSYLANREITENLVQEGKAALHAERVKEEEEKRIKEQDNYDGL